MGVDVEQMLKQYCVSTTEYARWKTREVRIGDIPLGGSHPIRVQSMTTTPTMDTQGTIDQSIRMIQAGCEYVRITAPSIREAENLEFIKAGLKKRGYDVPLIADIHFTPKAAEVAARHVEKVRINPGNYYDRKKFETIEYTDQGYQAELDEIHARFSPLVKICREYGTAIRIGTNHGSLSDRIMSRYGDSPLGMVESAMEFIAICEDHGFGDIVLSMKSSNPIVMVQAYRLLVNRMISTGKNYPLHLGVTEAGEGAEGRIKSAAGIGTLLEDGLGDTIRVSLTEEPEHEIPVALHLLQRYAHRKSEIEVEPSSPQFDPFNYRRRTTQSVLNIGGANPPRVIQTADVGIGQQPDLNRYGYRQIRDTGKWESSDVVADYLVLNGDLQRDAFPQELGLIIPDEQRSESFPPSVYPSIPASRPLDRLEMEYPVFKFIESAPGTDFAEETGKNVVFVLDGIPAKSMAQLRNEVIRLDQMGVKNPVVVACDYASLPEETALLYAATDLGGLFIDGLIDGIWLQNTAVSLESVFSIMQSTRARISKTEFISCPSCGRTLFDLQETSAGIRARTSHLKGVKIAIMGCIVNGPGEMADADYGYVGTGKGLISLYRGKEVVRKNIQTEYAVDELINIIQMDGNWSEPK